MEKSNFMEVISQILRPKVKEISNFKVFFFFFGSVNFQNFNEN